MLPVETPAEETSLDVKIPAVWLTRARERLYLSRAAVRTSWGVPNEFPASRFLSDLPEELLDWRRRESSMATLRADGGFGGAVSTRRAAPPSPDAPKFGSANPRPAGDVPSLAIGDRVTHDSYGLGTVVAVEGAGAGAVAKIDFGADGTKRLLLRYSPVTKL